jgi:hypothetical protein
MSAASDPDTSKALTSLSTIFDEIEMLHPDFILEREKLSTPIKADFTESVLENEVLSMDGPSPIEDDNGVEVDGDLSDIENASSNDIVASHGDVKIVIDKKDASTISFSDEEIKKIKKSRTVELNIVETKDLEMASIETLPTNSIDNVLAPYIRKTNDIVAALTE